MDFWKGSGVMFCPICNCNIDDCDEPLQQMHVNECIESKNQDIPTCPICSIKFENIEILDQHVIECLIVEENKRLEIPQPVLTPIQQKAMDICHKKAKIFSEGVEDNITDKLKSFGSEKPKDDMELLKRYFDIHVRFVIHIRVDNVLDFFLKDEFYRNLFETKKSGGSNNCKARKMWESNLFNRVYNNAIGSERVKYGALNLTCNAKGAPATCYGESFFTLKRVVHDRISFCVGDSSAEEMHMATFRYPLIALNLVSRQLLEEIYLLAKKGRYDGTTNYVQYLEGQIHGPLWLKRDIESIHVPKSYEKNEKIMQKLERFIELYNIPIIFF